MPTQPITLIKGDKIGLETDYRDALPVNMYAVARDILGAKGYMVVWPGLTQFASGFGIDRGGIYNERFGRQFRLSDVKFIEVNVDTTVDQLGEIPGTSQAAMPYSFNTQAVIADGRMFLYSPTTGFNEITDPDLGSPIDGVWIDGYYFLTDGEFIYHTDIDDETSIDPLKFATSELSPDGTKGVGKTADNKAIVFNRYTIEYFVNVSTANFAFQRIETRAQKIGIVATHAKCESKSSWYITGGSKEESVGVHLFSLGRAQKVSTREIDKILAAYSEEDLKDMRMETRMEDDVTFILVHLPNETLCLNENILLTIGKDFAWSILKTGTGNQNYRAINGVFDSRKSQWMYGDKYSNFIGILDKDVATQYGSIAEWILFTPFVLLDGLSVDQIEIETIPGQTSTNDAKVAFSISYNGLTYGKEYFMDYGGPQEYNQNFIIRRIGYINDWAGFKFRGASKSRMSFALMQVTYG